MPLAKQIYLYGIDTTCFYTNTEAKIQEKIFRLTQIKEKLRQRFDDGDYEEKWFKEHRTRLNVLQQQMKDQLKSEFKKHKNTVRHLRVNALTDKKVIGVFESSLTRYLQMQPGVVHIEMMIVQTYFFDIAEDIIKNGFLYKNIKYSFFSASAGQIRTKKSVVVQEKLLRKYEKTIKCGLSEKYINQHGGININKYIAYLSLVSSATELWKDFDITKTIVVEDFQTNVAGIVDYIDDKEYVIKRMEKNIPIVHTDGCGMILPQCSKKSFMVRLPWLKGLLTPFAFDKFAQMYRATTVTDIYGMEHDIIKEDIQIIFTKSQFKMYQYYDSWSQYIHNFQQYHCTAGKCNEEEDYLPNAKWNYQMLQTLTDITDEELLRITQPVRNKILNLSSDRDTMLSVFGATKQNPNKTPFQQALSLYPEMLSDVYSKEVLKLIKRKMVKTAKSAKFEINGKYTFILPDLYAFCECLFLKNSAPSGLLKNGEVFCRLYKKQTDLDCLRSPHLYREHAVRLNAIDNRKSKWFITNGLYTSCHDLISKMLQFDCDGDKSLVCADSTIIEVAKRNMYNVVPLYYEMANAPAVPITKQTIFDGIITAYTGGNIGIISNNISKIWNDTDCNLDAIKILCAENNFTIDFAKTLYKPKRPHDINTMLNMYSRKKVPAFFVYAKDKTMQQTEPFNSSPVNRLNSLIPNPRLKFTADNLGKFQYQMLMHNKNIQVNLDIVQRYQDLNMQCGFLLSIQNDEYQNIIYLYEKQKQELLALFHEEDLICDVLIKYLYENQKKDKDALWIMFGERMVSNLNKNLKNKLEDGYFLCKKCGRRIKKCAPNQNYCSTCAKLVKKENTRLRVNRYRKT